MSSQVKGVVTKYKGNGRKLGYPTANIEVTEQLKDGVYFGHADLARFKDYPALIFVGIPTTMGDTQRRLEVHLVGIPDVDYYGETITARLEHFHRPNQTFNSIDDLLEVMRQDEISAKKWLDLNRTA